GGVRRSGRGAVRLLHPGPDHRRARPDRADARPFGRGDPRGAGGQPVPVHRLREDHRRGPAGRRPEGGRMTLVVEDAYIAPVVGAEIPRGHLVIEGDRIAAVGPGPAAAPPGAERIDARGCLVTPGLVNTHHHLYQWAYQGVAPQGTLFQWLVASYPRWARMDAEVVHGAARAALGWLALSGCTTSTDHHYVFPKGRGDLFAATVEAAREVGLRFHPCRGSMDLGESGGGLPPDDVVEDIDTIMAHTEEVIDAYHDPSFSSALRVAVAPCSPFSVSADLMRASADLARAKGVRLHTHLAETLDEEEHCRE